MSLTKIQIISQALFQIGIGNINTINPENKSAVDAEKAFDILYPSVLSSQDWRFATKIQQLSRLVDAPIVDEWKFVFQLPADYLVAVRTYPLTYYQIYEDTLYANQEELKFEYRFNVIPTKAPMYFNTAMIYILAEYLTLPLAEKLEYIEVLKPAANEHLRKASFLDAQSHTNVSIQSNPFISVRFGSRRGGRQ